MKTFPTSLAVRRDRLSDQVARSLEGMILSGDFVVGDVLPSERDLMERYGVGRPAIREALLWLNKKGLLAVSGGERARVTAPNPSELLENLSGAALMFVQQPQGMQLFQQTRLFTEIALAREAAREPSTDGVAHLQRLLAANRDAGNDLVEFANTDDAFHYGIASLSNNLLVTALYNSVLTVLQDQRHTSLKHPAARDAAYGCHERIFEAIRSADPDVAEREMRHHLNDVETFYWEVRRLKQDRASQVE